MTKKFSILLTVLFFGTNPIFSQDFWRQLYFPDTVTIRCITTNSLKHIFIGVGNNAEWGGIYRSTDDGQSWHVVYDCNGFTLLSLTTNKSDYIYAGTDAISRLIVSKDNGANWDDIFLPPPSNGNVMKIHCIGQDTIFVSTWETNGALITYSFDGGVSWKCSYVTGHPNEYVSDIDLSSAVEIYVSTNCYFPDQGGIYKAVMEEEFIWEYVGLINHQVKTLEINSNNDVFTGDWWTMNSETPGIYAQYEGINTFNLILDAVFVTDIVIDTSNVIYACANKGVVRSYDNGQTFEYIDDELSYNMQFLHIGSNGYLYGIGVDNLAKSIEPIITGVNEDYFCEKIGFLKIFPNPVNRELFIDQNLIKDINGTCLIFIYDIFHNMVLKKIIDFNDGRFQLVVNNLSEGIYFIELNCGNEKYWSSFIRQ